ncbi:hypothetical protein K456DRAFT_334055 [Colletotrichum gloeosporioides 23]|nr:hypothetical protein K456DRAFT_334055 [Colletotrichum gloeosporioides 23]
MTETPRASPHASLRHLIPPLLIPTLCRFHLLEETPVGRLPKTASAITRTAPTSGTAVSPRALATAHNSSSTSWHNHQKSPPTAESSSPRPWAPTPSQHSSVLVPVPLPPHKAAYRLSRSDVVWMDGSGAELIGLRRLLACLCFPPALLSVLA